MRRGHGLLVTSRFISEFGLRNSAPFLHSQVGHAQDSYNDGPREAGHPQGPRVSHSTWRRGGEVRVVIWGEGGEGERG